MPKGRSFRDDINALKAFIPGSWSEETSFDPANWRPDNPAWGQCAVTALLLQELLGGELLRSTVAGISHYWNLIDGHEVDLTLQQFGPQARIDFPPCACDRRYVLSFPHTGLRYDLLRTRVLALRSNLRKTPERP